MALAKSETYTTDYIYALPDGVRAELIDGRIYEMPMPDRIHQALVGSISYAIADHIDSRQEYSEVYIAPFAVFLNKDSRNYVEPDISVICDKDKLDDRGCFGAPDWVIEIISPSTKQRDFGIKLFKYRTAGVREYWIVNPAARLVNVFDLEFEDEIPGCVFDDFRVRISDLID